MTKLAVKSRSAFEVKSLEIGEDGQRRPHIVAECSLCPATAQIPISNHSGNVPSEAGAKMFRRLGWKMGSARSKDECPACSAGAKMHALSDVRKIALAAVADRNSLHPRAAAVAYLSPARIDPEDAEEDVLMDREDEAEERVMENVCKRERKRLRRRGSDEQALRAKRPTVLAIPKATVTVGSQSDAASGDLAPGQSDRGRGIRAWWAAQTPEQRSEQARIRAETRRQKKLAAEPPPDPTPATKLTDPPAPDAVPSQPLLEETQLMSNSPQLTVVDAGSDPALRQPTVAQNRSIRDALDIHYDEERQTYKGEMRDRILAEQLNLPAAWIAKVREPLYGPDKCEADDQFTREVTALRGELDHLDERLVKAFETITEIEGDAKAIRARLDRTLAKQRLPLAS